MARLKGVNAYADELRKSVEERKGKYDTFLEPLVKVTATNWRTLDIVTRKMEKEGYTKTEYGSRGQAKDVAHPLTVHQEKCLRALRSNLQGLGLTYDIIPDKVTRAKKDDETPEPDMIDSLLNQVNFQP